MPRARIILLGLAAFLIALLVVFPAAWVKAALPQGVSCTSLSGSIWRGQCTGLAVAQPGMPALQLDTLGWKLHALQLLRGRVRADVTLAGSEVAAKGQFTLGSGGQVDVAGLSGNIALDHARLAALPAGWRAQAEARDASLEIDSGRIAALGGVLLARQLRDANGTAFGDFKLEFPRQDSAPFRGALTDQGGPMQLQAQLTLNADRSWQLRGTVRLRPGSPPGLASALDRLAPAGLDGLRNFSLEGAAN